jgi:hypothetical protein
MSINKENSITVLINSVRLGQKMGSYVLRETKLLKQAIDYFNPDVKDKPTFEDSENPEIVAVNLLLQGVQKAQAHGGEFSFSIDDAALLWDIMEFWIKEGGKEVTQNVNVSGSTSKEKNAKSAKQAASSVRSIKVEEDDEDYEDDAKLITVSKKGKNRED